MNTQTHSNPSISVVRSRHDGMSTDVTSIRTFGFGKVAARNLVKAARFTLETTGYEGYGAPYYSYTVSVAGVTVDDAISGLISAIESPSDLKYKSGPRTLTGLAQEVIDDVASGELN